MKYIALFYVIAVTFPVYSANDRPESPDYSSYYNGSNFIPATQPDGGAEAQASTHDSLESPWLFPGADSAGDNSQVQRPRTPGFVILRRLADNSPALGHEPEGMKTRSGRLYSGSKLPKRKRKKGSKNPPEAELAHKKSKNKPSDGVTEMASSELEILGVLATPAASRSTASKGAKPSAFIQTFGGASRVATTRFR